MKKVVYVSMVFAGSLLFTACGGGEEVITKENQGITMLADDPCTGPEFQTDGEVIRGIGSSESPNKNAAQKKAKSNAINEIAATLSQVFQGLTTNYLNERSEIDNFTVRGKMEDMQKTIIDQELKGANSICTKYGMRTNSQGQTLYICYTAYELSASSVADKYYKGLTEDAELRVDYDYEQYKEFARKEWEKLQQRKN